MTPTDPVREALQKTSDAIDEMFRYYDGGETRGSYDGRPERNQLRKAGYAAKAALSTPQQTAAVACVACCDKPSGDNDPCEVCYKTATRPAPAPNPSGDLVREDWHDVVTHRRPWRDAIVTARDFASEGSEDPQADRSYWNHELRVFDRTFDRLAAILALSDRQAGAQPVRMFALGNRVRKKKGSSWQGVVVGFYRTSLTPIGYAIESEREPGSVQIYPESAIEAVTPPSTDTGEAS